MRPTSFGKLLREHRLAAGLTQATLAERAGLSVRAVQHLERCLGQPQRETTRRLADALALGPGQRARFELAAAPAPRRRGAGREARADGGLGESVGELLASPSSLAGERKRVTVLFADVVGLTESVQGFEPDLADRLLAELVRLLVDVAHQYGGTVSWVRGDAVLALFGAPIAHEDHAVRACSAALAMHEAFRRQVGQVVEAQVALRIGLDSGEVVVRTTANDLASGYTAIGPAVRLATQLEQLAADGTSLLSRETLRLAEGYFELRPVSVGSVGGITEPLEAFELVGVGPPQSRFQRVQRTRQLSRFVGREAELVALARPFGRARDGHGEIVAVVGEPGVGKSRLVWEATHSQRTEGWLVLESGGVSYGSGTPYLPAIELLKSYCRIEARDDGSAARDKLAGRVLTLDEGLATDLPALLSLLELPVDDPGWAALDPPQRRRWTLDALKRLLLRQSLAQPLLLVFEDLHWIDGETQALLDSLVNSLPTARLLLLVTYRPEYQHRWSSKSYYTQLRIDVLPAGSADELLNELLGDEAALQPLKQLLIERTEGNPLFLEESVRALAESGVLVGERGTYRLAKPIKAVRVPASVQTVLAARIDRLEPEVKRLLQSAAVIGKDVSYSLLRAIVDGDEQRLRGNLARLQAAELVYEAGLFPELEYTFKHALTHEVAYDSLLQDSRRTTHRRVVEAIEQLYADRLGEEVERLAYHAIRGEVWDKALSYARQAGLKAVQRSALPQAVAHFEQALAALGRLPQTRQALEQAIDLRLDIRSALYPLGEFGRIVERLREAESIAAALDDQSRLARLSAYLASSWNTMGRHDLAVQPARRALSIGESSDDFGARVLGNHFLGLTYYGLGAYGRSVEHLRWNVESLQGDLLNERFGMHGLMSVFSRSPLIWCLAELGEFREAIARNQESFQIAEATKHAPTRGGAYMGASLLHVRSGDLHSAILVGERGLELCRTWGLRAVFPYVAAQLGYAHALAGRVAAGLTLLREAIEAAESVGHQRGYALWIGWLAEAFALAGQPAEARDQAGRALALARERKERGAEAWALRLQAEVSLRQERPDAESAERFYRQALILAEELGMRPLQAHCHAGLGNLYLAFGRAEAGQAELFSAAESYRALEMGFWLTRVQAWLAEAR